MGCRRRAAERRLQPGCGARVRGDWRGTVRYRDYGAPCSTASCTATPNLDRVPPAVRPLIEHCLAKDPGPAPHRRATCWPRWVPCSRAGTWLPESFTRTFAQGTPSRPGFAWSGPVAAAAGGARGGCRGPGRIRRSPGRLGDGRDAGPGQLAVYRSGGADRHRAARRRPRRWGPIPRPRRRPCLAGTGPAAATAPDEAAGAGAHPRRHRRSGRRGRVRGDLVHGAGRPTQLEQPGGADIPGDGARIRGPGGQVGNDRAVRVAERVVVGAFGWRVHGRSRRGSVLIHPDDAPDHPHVTHDVNYLA